MKVEFKVKYLQYLSDKNENQGFTWLDLLILVIVFGMLAAITLPTFLARIYVPKISEAENNIGAMNRAQQAYFLEWQEFTNSLTDLGVGIKAESENYRYQIIALPERRPFQKSNETVLFHVDKYALNIAQSKKPNLRTYIGIVGTNVTNQATAGCVEVTTALACESEKPTTLSPIPTLGKDISGIIEGRCPKGYKKLERKPS